MEIIAHRINKISELRKLPKKFGAEVDLRTYGSKIILGHEPYVKGENFKDYLENYNNGTLVLNIKESGIENDVIKTVKKFNIKNFFLLDLEMPFICKNNIQKKYLSLRFSEYESIETAKNLIHKSKWIWIDTFKILPIKKSNIRILKKFKSCLVCPERWGRPHDIKNYFNKLKKLDYFPNSIMTSKKYANKWEKLIFRP